jgi:hypothetical protein
VNLPQLDGERPASASLPRAKLGVLLRALALLAATASALTLFGFELRVKTGDALLTANDLTARNRNLATLQMLGAAAVALVLGALYLLRAGEARRPAAVAWLRWLSHLLAPGLLLPFVPALLTLGWADLPTTVAV